MPVVVWYLGLAVVSVVGVREVNNTIDKTSSLAKWVAIGGGVYIAGKYAKAW